MIGVPYATEPWNEITPGLWQGGHDYRRNDGAIVTAVPRFEFNLVVTLYRARCCRTTPGCGPDPGVEHIVCEVPDGPLLDLDRVELGETADRAAELVTAGKRVLVRCQAGYNRSGLVVALTLIRLGYTADAAVALIRERRSPHALFNEHFQRYIREVARA
jgi:protein-tyrosine phosphatase